MVHVGTCRRQRNWLNMIKEFNSGPVDKATDVPGNTYLLYGDLSGG